MKRFLVPSGVFAALLLLSVASVDAQAPKSVQQKQSPALFAHKNIEQAWKAAVVGKKPLVVMFTSDSCIYCQKMLKQTYQHPSIQRMLVDNTETVLAHANQYRDLVKKLGIRGYPTTMIVSHEGKVLDLMPGYVEPKVFAQRLHPILLKSRSPQAAPNAAVAVSSAER